MQDRAQRADHLYRLGYQRAQEADKRAQEAKRKFEEEKARFRAQIEERRREAERLQQLANQKRLEAQEARRRAQEQKEIGLLEARRATLLLLGTPHFALPRVTHPFSFPLQSVFLKTSTARAPQATSTLSRPRETRLRSQP